MFTDIMRKDGKVARLELSDGDEDFWEAIEKDWPQSYDHIDESMVIPGETCWDVHFDLGEDAELRDWIMEGRE